MKPASLVYEVLSSAGAVWVNDASCHCIGRFGRLGVDVHHPAAAQLVHGDQCLACSHGRTDEDDWQRFRALMLEHHGAVVPDAARPGFLVGDGARVGAAT
jgi:hypothetical protein